MNNKQMNNMNNKQMNNMNNKLMNNIAIIKSINRKTPLLSHIAYFIY